MSNEYPPRPTEMCKPVINGTNVVSDVYEYYINNKLNKAIDEYWQSKYKTFAKGRIKRMRTRRKPRFARLDIRFDEKAYSFKSGYCFNGTRYNGHYAPEK